MIDKVELLKWLSEEANGYTSTDDRSTGYHHAIKVIESGEFDTVDDWEKRFEIAFENNVNYINENKRLKELLDKQHDEFYNEVRIAHQEKEMSSYNHAKYAGELRKEINSLKGVLRDIVRFYVDQEINDRQFREVVELLVRNAIRGTGKKDDEE